MSNQRVKETRNTCGSENRSGDSPFPPHISLETPFSDAHCSISSVSEILSPPWRNVPSYKIRNGELLIYKNRCSYIHFLSRSISETCVDPDPDSDLNLNRKSQPLTSYSFIVSRKSPINEWQKRETPVVRKIDPVILTGETPDVATVAVFEPTEPRSEAPVAPASRRSVNRARSKQVLRQGLPPVGTRTIIAHTYTAHPSHLH